MKIYEFLAVQLEPQVTKENKKAICYLKKKKSNDSLLIYHAHTNCLLRFQFLHCPVANFNQNVRYVTYTYYPHTSDVIIKITSKKKKKKILPSTAKHKTKSYYKIRRYTAGLLKSCTKSFVTKCNTRACNVPGKFFTTRKIF